MLKSYVTCLNHNFRYKNKNFLLDFSSINVFLESFLKNSKKISFLKKNDDFKNFDMIINHDLEYMATDNIVDNIKLIVKKRYSEIRIKAIINNFEHRYTLVNKNINNYFTKEFLKMLFIRNYAFFKILQLDYLKRNKLI